MSVESTRSVPQFLNYDCSCGYIPPNFPEETCKKISERRKQILEQSLDFLGTFTKVKPRKTLCCKPLCKNSACFLATYMLNKPIEIFRSFIGCNKKNIDPVPVPKEAYETLAGTGNMFKRNLCGLFGVAQIAIFGAPFVPMDPAILSMVQGEVITTAAGTLTYVGSGDIGVVADRVLGEDDKEDYDLIIQGGIRVDAISIIKDAYLQLAQHIEREWSVFTGHESAKYSSEKTRLAERCLKIEACWNNIYTGIKDCGVKEIVVEQSLAPLADQIRRVKKEYLPAGGVVIHIDRSDAIGLELPESEQKLAFDQVAG